MSQVIAGRYQLLEPLGHGGRGTVRRARDRVLGRTVAVKEVPLPPGLDRAGLERMYDRAFREARALAGLDHPGVVAVHDVVRDDDRPWIVMPLVRAASLDRVVIEEGLLPPARIAAIGLDLLDALRAAHAAGVVHRDVKPRNVLLTTDRAVLTGFDVTAATDDGQGGTAAYRSPEQHRRQKATPVSDLWSLGATLNYAAAPDDGLRSVLRGLLREDPSRRMGREETESLLRRIADGGETGGRSGRGHPLPVVSRTGRTVAFGSRRADGGGVRPRPDGSAAR
ncbi:serine/threonine-protein kinase [Actinomadura macrotermitis]|uniref:non-specific serine/threonine protein kinase n=1 Tax=Actinomadura macrotermitis TaxID=2585200 RepID=A0A7K0BR94_9ACTN|nr:serine/threonine-protein kinase [Actinomadura macrotermitis]MQY03422.1 Serine/threonine-protein kinase PknD [Actinomadura macrotermitis]